MELKQEKKETEADQNLKDAVGIYSFYGMIGYIVTGVAQIAFVIAAVVINIRKNRSEKEIRRAMHQKKN